MAANGYFPFSQSYALGRIGPTQVSFNEFWIGILMVLAVVLSVSGFAPAHAATFTVTNLYDSGSGSLRQAITDANANVGADIITFSVSGTIPLGSTLPNITDTARLTMDGTGQMVTISGGNAVRVLIVNSGVLLSLSNLTIANGKSSFLPYDGGGISNFGTLTVTNCTFSGNTATSGASINGYGGGIVNGSGILIVTNSTFAGNSGDSGGGVYNNTGAMSITDSTFSGNSGGNGGGVYNNAGAMSITNSTFSGNSGGNGGGVFSIHAAISITNSTFAGNSATSGGSGGGIYNNSGIVTIHNTIVANSVSGENCYSTITIINGGNNIDDGTSCGWGSTNGSMSSANPSLGPLANNGGPTKTLALLTGSPAINGITFNAPNGAPSTDQRGVARPRGARYDIGAYERNAPNLTPILMLLLD